MLDDLAGFEWDEHNAAHEVMPQEVEEAVRGRHVILPAMSKAGEKRWKLMGKAASGRYLVVVFTVRRSDSGP